MNKKDTLVAIVGGSGFIGSYTTDELLRHGYTVRIIDVVAPARSDVEFIRCDILSLDNIIAALTGVDYVYVLAAISDANDNYKFPILSINTNITGLGNTLEACVRNKVKRVLFSSTVWVYSAASPVEVDEETAINNNNIEHIYTCSKITGESLIQSYNKLYGLDYTIFRYGIAYGPGANSDTVIATFIRNALKKQPLVVQGDGSYYRNFLYVTDHARGNVRGLSPKARNQIINLEGPEQITVDEVANAVSSYIENTSIIYDSSRTGDYKGKIVSRKKAKKLLGWEPQVMFKQGIKTYLDEFTKL